MHLVEVLEADGEAKVDSGYQVLNFEIDELHIVAELLDNSSKLSRCQVGVDFVPGTCAHQFARPKDERSASWLSDSHYDPMKSLWIVLGVPRSEVDLLEIEFAA